MITVPPVQEAPAAAAAGESRIRTGRRRVAWRLGRAALSLAVVGLAAYFLSTRWSALQQAGGLLRHVGWRWIGLAVLFEMASMVVFARMQRVLLRAGGADLELRTMVEITLAGNAVAATLPGGVAWAAAWAFGQLRRRGVDRFLRVWTFLVAGAISSFALFVVVALGIGLAGSRGPVSGLRWGALGLAAVPLLAVAVFLARHTWLVDRVRGLLRAGAARLPGGRWIERAVQSLYQRVEAVRLSPAIWLEVLGLALLNWLYDGLVLVVSVLAIGAGVPWRQIFVVYGITQVAATLPLTPGGLGVVEGSLVALLHAYGLTIEQAIAAAVVYRLVSFWGLVPVGWGAWLSLDLLQRRRRRAAGTAPVVFVDRVPGTYDRASDVDDSSCEERTSEVGDCHDGRSRGNPDGEVVSGPVPAGHGDGRLPAHGARRLGGDRPLRGAGVRLQR